MKIAFGLLAFATLAVASMSAGTATAATTLVGDTVTCTRNGVPCSGVSTAVVGPGAEFSRPSTFDFDATGLTFTPLPGGSFVDPLIYSFADTTNPFTSISNISFTGNTGLSISDITFNSGVISFNLSGKLYDAGSSARLSINSAVPEPATWAMMLLGFGGMGVSMRRRRTTARRLQTA